MNLVAIAEKPLFDILSNGEPILRSNEGKTNIYNKLISIQLTFLIISIYNEYF